jgi:hypothetical protein
MEGGEGEQVEWASNLLQSHLITVVYFAVLLVLLLLIVWSLRNKKENLIGSGVQDQVFTAGATIRRLGQEFSGTNQGEYTIVHNDELKELVPGSVGKERLVSERGEPDFWEISSELNAYKDSQVAPMAADAGKEYLARDSVASMVQDQLLTQQLYH